LDTPLPLVSIVTPSFNQSRFLEAAIRSVLEQDYPRIEYIVMDGGSTDGSREIIQRYADRLAAWTSAPDEGQTDAINRGFAQCSGEIFAWLNSDDTYRPGAVAAAVRYLQAHRDAGMVYGKAYYIDEADRVVGRYPAAPTDLRGLQRGRTTIPQQAMFFRAKLWRMVGPLDPTFFYAMDYDLWVRLASLSTIAFVPEAWANFRLQEASKSLTAASRCWPEMMRVHFRNGGSRVSVLYAKYLVRRIVEPVMPWRMRIRRWTYAWETRKSEGSRE
jgi:glycosyltransferase involved in cell wall biosynthesis